VTVERGRQARVEATEGAHGDPERVESGVDVLGANSSSGGLLQDLCVVDGANRRVRPGRPARDDVPLRLAVHEREQRRCVEDDHSLAGPLSSAAASRRRSAISSSLRFEPVALADANRSHSSRSAARRLGSHMLSGSSVAAAPDMRTTVLPDKSPVHGDWGEDRPLASRRCSQVTSTAIPTAAIPQSTAGTTNTSGRREGPHAPRARRPAHCPPPGRPPSRACRPSGSSRSPRRRTSWGGGSARRVPPRRPVRWRRRPARVPPPR
jgi:hypothetical protein